MDPEHAADERRGKAPAGGAPAPHDIESLSLGTLAAARLAIDSRLVATLDLAGAFLFANRATVRTFGIPLDELLRCSLFELAHPDDESSLRDAFTVAAGGGCVTEVQIRTRDAAGGWATLLLSASGLANGRGEPIAVAASAVDITRTLALEDENRAQRNLLLALVGASEMLVVELSGDLVVAGWNAAAESVLEVGATFALGKNFLELCVPEDFRNELKKELAEVRDRGARARREISVTAGREGARTISWTFVPARDGGRSEGVVALGHDLTPLRVAQRGERRADALVDSLVCGITEGIFVTSPAGRIRHWNRAMERLTGVTREAALDRKPQEAVPWLANSGFALVHDDLLAGRLTSHQAPARQIDTPSGRTMVAVRCVPFRVESSAAGAGVVVVVEDQSEVLRLRAESEGRAGRERVLLELCGDCVYTIDAAGKVLEMNPAARRVDGRVPAQRLVGRRLDEFVDPESRPGLLGAIARARGSDPIAASYTTTTESGAATWGAVLSALLDTGGRLTCIVVVAREATRTGLDYRPTLGAGA